MSIKFEHEIKEIQNYNTGKGLEFFVLKKLNNFNCFKYIYNFPSTLSAKDSLIYTTTLNQISNTINTAPKPESMK